MATSILGSDTIRKKRRVTPTLSVSMRDFDAPPASTAYQYIEEHYRDTLQAQEHLYSSLWRCLSSSMVTSWRPIRDLAGLPQLAVARPMVHERFDGARFFGWHHSVGIGEWCRSARHVPERAAGTQRTHGIDDRPRTTILFAFVTLLSPVEM